MAGDGMPALSAVPTSAEAQAVCDAFMQPYKEHMAALETLPQREEILKAVHPDAIIGRFNEGARIILARGPTALSTSTSVQLRRWLETHDAQAAPLREHWQLVSGNAATNFLRGARIGMTSQEAAVGRSLGSFLGPWGSAVGGALGALAAASQDSEQIQDSYWNAFTHWIAAASSDFDLRVLPCIERDLHPWPQRLRSLAGWIAFIAVAAGAAWLVIR